MKVQQLIEKYKKLEGVWDAPGAETARQIFLQDLEQLDEPQKPVVPQFVAEYIKYARSHDWDLQDVMDSDFIASSSEEFHVVVCIKPIRKFPIFFACYKI